MDKSSFFSSLGGYLKANKAFFLSVLFILLATGGYFWWQAGFTVDFSRFFAADVTVVINSSQPIQHNQRVSVSWSALWADEGCDASAWINTRGVNEGTATSDPVDACAASGASFNITCCDSGGTCATGTGSFSINQSTCPTTPKCGDGTCNGSENPVSCPADCGGGSASPSPSVTVSTGPAVDACTGKPTREGDGVKVCITNNTFGNDFDRETNYKGPGGSYTYTVHIINDSSSRVFGKTAQGVSLFYCPVARDGAVDNDAGAGCTTVGVAGICNNCTSGVAANSEGDVTFNFTPGESCGTYQLDSTWNPFNTFVIGKVINTGVNCPTPSPSTPAASPSTSPSTPPASPSASPSTPPASPSTSPSTPPASPSTSPTSEPEPLSCVSGVSQAGVGQPVQFTAEGGASPFTWHAPGGTPESNVGPAFSASFSYDTPGFKTVTVVSGNNQAVCTVTILAPAVSPSTSPSAEVSPSASPAVSPSGSPDSSPSTSPVVSPSSGGLVCSPVTQDVRVNRAVTVSASGGTPSSYQWTASSGDPSTASGSASFTTEYTRTGTYTIVVRSGALSASCNVRVTSGGNDSNFTHLECVNNTCARVSGEGSNECSTVGASCSGGGGTTPRLALEKLVRNVTQNSSEQSSVTASPTNTVEFSLKVSSNGSGSANNVTIRDSLPAGLTYVSGSTKIDGVAAADGIVSTGLSLGTMPSGRTITVRFRATVASASFFSAGTTVLSNIGYARASNAPEVADVAFVSVVQIPANTTLSLTKTGRNVTRGETAEASLVRTSAAQTIEFVLRARNTSAKTMENVMIRDVLPPAITLVPGSVRIGTASASNSLTAAGLSLGSLTSGQEVVVRFSGLVASSGQLPAGTTTVINSATVSATGQSPITAQLPIVITSGLIVPPVATGPGETTVLALIISAIITLLYVGYTSTETYRRHEAGAIAQESRGDTSDFK